MLSRPLPLAINIVCIAHIAIDEWSANVRVLVSCRGSDRVVVGLRESRRVVGRGTSAGGTILP